MNALIEIETITAAKLFAPGGWQEIVSKLEADVRAMPKEDVTTEDGRKAIASLAYKVARSKTALEEVGKSHVAVLKKQAKVIDEDRAAIRDRLQTLQDEVRAPLTEWEQAEKARVEEHANAILAIRELGFLRHGMDGTVALNERLAEIQKLVGRDFQEFHESANAAYTEADTAIREALTVAREREANEIELARLRAETLARAQRERDEAIAREAAEKATREAEAKAAQAAHEAEEMRLASIARAEEAERKAKAAAERAEFEKAQAIEEERRRAKGEAKRLADEAAAREADKEHRRKINNGAVAALAAAGVSKEAAKLVIELIAKRMIPNVTINY